MISASQPTRTAFRQPRSHSAGFDQLYGYDDLNRLTSMNQGTLNSGNNSISAPTLTQGWELDATGNWTGYDQSNATPAYQTTRAHNQANELESITTDSGTLTWATPPDYDANGNMTEFPQPKDLSDSYTATWDAWNRLVKLEDGANTVAEYEYDGLNRRITKTVDSTVRHFYYSDQWQVLEERVGSSTAADKQYVWGMRYVDDLVLFDKGSARHYSLQDANWNVVAMVDDAGAIQERYAYTPYGTPEFLNGSFVPHSTQISDIDNEYLYTGRRLDPATGFSCPQRGSRIWIRPPSACTTAARPDPSFCGAVAA